MGEQESCNQKLAEAWLCLRRILGITKAQQRIGRITSAEVRSRFGVEEVLDNVVVAKRWSWAGHVDCMDDCCLPKRLLFGWLPHLPWRPTHGTKLRWRGRVRKDQKQFKIEESNWFHEARDRRHQRIKCKEGLTTCTEERERMGSRVGSRIFSQGGL